MHISFLLDKSGSMGSIRRAAIEGFNGFIAEQREVPGDATLTLAQFSGHMGITFSSVPLGSVGDLDAYSYVPGGSTALYQSICNLIDQEVRAHPEEQVIFAILTDGDDTDDRGGTWRRAANRKIAEMRERGWQFLFLGANINVEEYADSLGIDRQFAYSFQANAAGAAAGYNTLSTATKGLRGTTY